jgi:hypothetical protein
MRNLTEIFLASAPSRFKLPFGVNKGVVLVSLDNEIRRDKNGVKIAKNCFMTFASTDKEDGNRVTAQTTFNYFNIDKPAYATKSFIHQFTHIIEIAAAVVPKDKIGGVMQKLQGTLQEDAELFAAISKEPTPTAKMTKEIAELQTKVVNTFIEAVGPFTGENGDPVNLVVITDAKGAFFDLPREDKGFITKADSGKELHVDAKYARWYAEKDKVEKDKAEDIGAEDIIDEESIIMEDKDELDGI